MDTFEVVSHGTLGTRRTYHGITALAGHAQKAAKEHLQRYYPGYELCDFHRPNLLTTTVEAYSLTHGVKLWIYDTTRSKACML